MSIAKWAKETSLKSVVASELSKGFSAVYKCKIEEARAITSSGGSEGIQLIVSYASKYIPIKTVVQKGSGKQFFRNENRVLHKVDFKEVETGKKRLETDTFYFWSKNDSPIRGRFELMQKIFYVALGGKTKPEFSIKEMKAKNVWDNDKKERVEKELPQFNELIGKELLISIRMEKKYRQKRVDFYSGEETNSKDNVHWMPNYDAGLNLNFTIQNVFFPETMQTLSEFTEKKQATTIYKELYLCKDTIEKKKDIEALDEERKQKCIAVNGKANTDSYFAYTGALSSSDDDPFAEADDDGDSDFPF